MAMGMAMGMATGMAMGMAMGAFKVEIFNISRLKS